MSGGVIYLRNRTRINFDALAGVVAAAARQALVTASPRIKILISWGKSTNGVAAFAKTKGRKVFGTWISIRIRHRGFKNYGAHELALCVFGTIVHELYHAWEYRSEKFLQMKERNRPGLVWNRRPWERKATIMQAMAIRDVVMGKDRQARKAIDNLAKELVRLEVCWA